MSTVLPPFVVTAAAVEQIEAVGGLVRVDVEAGGCCGSAYVFSAGAADRSDLHFGCPGAVLAVSRVALPVLAGAELDYSGRVKPPRFRVIGNPNTPERCPCNRSFGGQWPGRGRPDCRAAAPMPWEG